MGMPKGAASAGAMEAIREGYNTVKLISDRMGRTRGNTRETIRLLRQKNLVKVIDRDFETGEVVLALVENDDGE